MALQVDPLNLSVVKLTAMFDRTELGPATGFFYSAVVNNERQLFLVTNWHVVSGRNTLAPERALLSTGALPNCLRMKLLSEFGGDGKPHPDQVFHHEKFLSLYDSNGHAVWYQHALMNEVDIAVINIGQEFDGFDVRPIDEIANFWDMAISIGDDVLVLGYPLGFSHQLEMPTWKKGCIASEPHVEVVGANGRIVIDATTRSGMSGSPVIVKAKTHYLTEGGTVVMRPNASRLLGVYSSRPVLAAPANSMDESDRRAEVGYVYKSGLVEQIIRNGVRGHNFGDFPSPSSMLPSS